MFRYITSPSKSFIFTTLALVVLLVVLTQSGVDWWLSIAICVLISVPINLILANIDRRRITESARRESEQEQGYGGRPQSGNRKRLQPRMSRFGFRFNASVLCFLAVLNLVLVIRSFLSDEGWVLGDYIYLVTLVAAVSFLAYLFLRVRPNDSPFWDEEEAQRHR